MLLSEFIKSSVSALCGRYPQDEARSLVCLLCEDMIGTKPYTHIIDPSYIIPEDKAGALADGVRRLLENEPLQYVTGKAYFAGREFRVCPDVLIPRVETEQLCMMIASEWAGKEGLRILDLCTGSGCIAWTLSAEIPGSEVSACDISPKALDVAASQDMEGVRPPVFFQADVLSENIPAGGMFDIIVSNPPYVKEEEKALMRPNVLDYEPGMALFVPDTDPLLFYRAIASIASERLSGTGYAEINESLGPETAKVFEDAGFADVDIVRDIHGKDRFVRFGK